MECVLLMMPSDEAASAVAVIVPSPLAGEGGSMLPRARMGEGCLLERNPSPIRVRGHTIVPSPARGEGTRGERRAFWRNEANGHFAIRSSPRGAPRDARVAGTPLRGPIITAGGYGSRLSPRFREGRPGRRSLGPGEAPTCGCTKSGPRQFPCFGVVIYNDFCNSHVSGRRGPICYPKCVTPYVTPMWHHPS
jgi:hypothetical protein